MVVEALEDRIRNGELVFDPRQLAAARRLQTLARELEEQPPAAAANARLGFWQRLTQPSASGPPASPRGVYIHGDVGRGKSMLMDLFFESVDIGAKRRVHFHEFMLEVQRRLAALRQNGGKADPLRLLAADLARDTRLLCFDEFHVVNIADAMILGRLFQHLFASNVVIVATSNSGPRDLYRDGLNRQLFTPFIKLIEERMETYQLESAKDYRLEKLQGSDLYLTPADARAVAAMDASFRKLTGRTRGEPQTLNHKGRSIVVPEAALGVARFTFADLCVTPLGSLDYQRIAHSFHTLMIEEIPVLGPEQRNEARRLMILIDVLYDNGVGLIASAAAEPHALYVDGTGAESFARTASRLMEMRSETYLSERNRR
jgi:cell division protein ZapE